jgi:predicted enzyme related to lactoylglutathione lyase
MPDGTRQEPGGWNRFALEVDDLEAAVGQLQEAGVPFRNDIITGIGGRQALAQDASGNLVELLVRNQRFPNVLWVTSGDLEPRQEGPGAGP